MTCESIESLVALRLIEAAETERKLPAARVRPEGYKGTWPLMDPPTWGDVLQYGTKRLEEMRQEFFDNFRARVSPQEIARMDETAAWVRDHVTRDEDRRAVFAWARMKAGGLSLRAWCRRNGIGVNTAKRRADTAISEIAAAFGNSSEFLMVLPSSCVVTQTPEIGIQMTTMDDCAQEKVSSWMASDAKPQAHDEDDPDAVQASAKAIELHNKAMRRRAASIEARKREKLGLAEAA